ncbi:MAG: alpha/beta hydrolase [Porticoccaceae bacterium]
MSYIDAVEKVEVPRPPKHYTEPSFAEVLGVPIAYRRQGNGEAVVFLHGAGFTRRWVPMYEMLAQKFDFIAPESPGFGETPMPPWFRDFSDLSILYDQLFEQLGLDQIHLIGYSMGGWAAAEFASYYPRRLKSLSLVVPIGLRLEDNPGVDLFQLSPQQLMDRLFNDKKVMAEFMEGMDDFDEGIHLYSEMSAAARLIWAPRYNLALERRLQRLTCPTLVVRAEDDHLVPNQMAEKFATTLPNNRLAMIPETGHELCLERPAELARELADFIKEASK